MIIPALWFTLIISNTTRYVISVVNDDGGVEFLHLLLVVFSAYMFFDQAKKEFPRP